MMLRTTTNKPSQTKKSVSIPNDKGKGRAIVCLLIILALLIAALAYSMRVCWRKFYIENPELNVQEIIVTETQNYSGPKVDGKVSIHTILSELGVETDLNNNIIDLDIRQIRERLEQEPILKNIEVRKIMPHTLSISFDERTPQAVCAAEPVATVVVVHGTDIAKMVEAGIAKMGGWDKFFKPGGKVALKPNLAWKSTPEQGGNTHPDILRAVVLAAEARKVGKITIPENTCQPEQKTFETSGANGALKGTGAKLYRPKRGDFTAVSVPKGKVCQEAKVSRDLVEADCLVNMPVAKHHGGATLSLSMKNWMGSVKDRGFWHRNDLNECIVDFNSFLKPQLVVVDATRIMLDKGPQGPGPLAHPNEIIFSKDTVAADAYAATLFPDRKPEDIKYIRLGDERKVGSMKYRLERIEM